MGAATADVPERENWFIGEDRVLEFLVDDGTPVAQGGNVPTGMGSWTLKYELRARAVDTTAIISKGMAAMNVNATTGLVKVTIAKADYPATMRGGTYKHALIRTDPGGWGDVSVGDAVLQVSPAR